MEEKLTYPQIVNLAAAGQYEKIPEGYTIKWFGDQHPRTLYDYLIPKEGITLSGNNQPPAPDYARIKGELVVQPYYGDEYEEPEPLEYGEVLLMTCLVLSKLQFLYHPGTVDGKTLMEYIRKNAEFVTGRVVPKKDLVFDGEFRFENVVFKLHAMMNTSADFGPLEYEEPTDAVLDFVYDYMSQEILPDD